MTQLPSSSEQEGYEEDDEEEVIAGGVLACGIPPLVIPVGYRLEQDRSFSKDGVFLIGWAVFREWEVGKNPILSARLLRGVVRIIHLMSDHAHLYVDGSLDGEQARWHCQARLALVQGYYALTVGAAVELQVHRILIENRASYSVIAL